MAARSSDADRRIARLAARAHGVVARRELLRAGLTRHEIAGRVERGVLIRVHAGVYRVGHAAPSVEARFMAAVKACGRGAALSGLAAAHLLGLVKRPPSLPEVSAPAHRDIEGIRTRRRARVARTTHRGIAVTTPAQTLVDIAARLDEDELARACHEAGVKHRTTPRQVRAVLERASNTPGAAKLRAVIDGETKVSLSALESAFRERLREAGLPQPPECNRRAGGYRVDCRWPEHRLTVELDSYRFHNSRHAWEHDRRREREAYARGDHHRRYTHHDVFDDPAPMLCELRSLLIR